MAELESIVMPSYNDEKYVDMAIRDMISQTHSSIELIIVDDGSTDKTPEICKSYADKYDFIHFYQKENGGTGSALNYGFSKSTGLYGTWVSSDDRHPEDAIQKMVAALTEKDVELVFTSYYSERFNRAWRSYTPSPDALGYKWEQNGFIHDLYTSGKIFVVDNWVDINLACCHSGVTFMFTMDLKIKAGDYLQMPGEDYHMQAKMGMLAKNNKVAYIDDILGWHRFPDTSLTFNNPACVLHAEEITKRMIIHWLETGKIND